MPISLWLWWMAWFKFQGPPGSLGDDVRAATVALEVAKPYTPDDKCRLENFLRPGRLPSDYESWLNFGEDEQGPVEYFVE